MQRKELTLLQKIISSILLIGIGIAGTLGLVWIIKVLINAIF